MKRNRLKPRWQTFNFWHRYVGLAAAVLVVLLAVTGFALNHTEKLGLGERPVAADWLLDWYGLAPGGEPVSYALDGGRWITWLEGRLFLGDRMIASDAGELKGAAAAPGAIVLAEGGGLRVLAEDGATIEIVPPYALPGPVQALAPGSVFATSAGTFRYDIESGRAEPFAGEAEWTQPADPPREVTDAVLAAYRGEGLSLERVLLDLHSGRLFGRIGPLVMDAAAVLLLVLTVTGIVIWMKNRRQMRR